MCLEYVNDSEDLGLSGTANIKQNEIAVKFMNC